MIRSERRKSEKKEDAGALYTRSLLLRNSPEDVSCQDLCTRSLQELSLSLCTDLLKRSLGKTSGQDIYKRSLGKIYL